MRRVLSVRGWSVMELVLVLIAVAVLGAVGMLYYRPTDVTARFQGERLSADIRHMQMMAMAWNVTLRLTATATAYSVTCETSTAAPCPPLVTTAITDPATGGAFTVTLGTGLGLTGPTAIPVVDHLRIDSEGRPVNVGGAALTTDTTYTITLGVSGPLLETVTVKPLTGFTTVSP